MLSCCTNAQLMDVPDITVYMNCDTRLAINLSMFELCEYDEFIFAVKNYNYIDSSYAFLFRARKSNMDEHGEVIFSIDPDASKAIKPGAFYNFAVLENAFNPSLPTVYKKLTRNGNIIIEYGAHDLAMPEPEMPKIPYTEILAAHVEPTTEPEASNVLGVITNAYLEEITDV